MSLTTETFRYSTGQEQLPPDVRALLSRLRSQESQGEPTAVTNEYLRQLRAHGWTLRVLANGFDNVNVEAVRERIMRAEVALERAGQPIDGEAGEVYPDPPSLAHLDPQPPVAPARTQRTPPKQPRERYEIPADVAARLQELQQIAQQLRGSTAEDSPVWQSAKELAELMNQERENGATLVEIGAAAGVTWSAVKYRLGRWGYHKLPPSMEHTVIQHREPE